MTDIVSSVIATHGSSNLDYIDRMRESWNEDPYEAIALVEGSKSYSGEHELLLVDWRNDSRRQEAGVFMAHVGLHMTASSHLPVSDRVTRVHQTNKGKLFIDYDHCTYETHAGVVLTIAERRIVLPLEGIAVASLFRARTGN